MSELSSSPKVRVGDRGRSFSLGDRYGERANLTSQLSIDNLFENNTKWVEKVNSKHPEFFERLAIQQTPDFLWIGCADSRVAANEIVGLLPGELFVHRNVANVVAHTDFNCLSVLQYAVDCLRVKHVIVCGHYGCGGVLATMHGTRVGLADNWLRHVDDVLEKHKECLDCYNDDLYIKGNHLCELNAIEQARNVCKTTVIRDAWARGQRVTVHAFIYGMRDGKLKDLKMSSSSEEEYIRNYQIAISSLPEYE
jgi:carbonic anhydrase